MALSKRTDHSSSAHGDLAKTPEADNWIEKLPPGLRARWKKSWIRRAAKHLHFDEGMPVGQAIATAKNAAEKGCATGDLNFRGKQSVNSGSRAEMCAAVVLWREMRLSARGKSVRNLSSDVFSDPDEMEVVNLAWNPSKQRRAPGGKFGSGTGVGSGPTVVAFVSAITMLQEGQSVDIPGGKGVVRRVEGGLQVRAGDGSFNKIFKNPSQAVAAAKKIAVSRYGRTKEVKKP